MNKWLNVKFWRHPTPINIFIIIIGVFVFLGGFAVGISALFYWLLWCLTWVSTWPWSWLVV